MKLLRLFAFCALGDPQGLCWVIDDSSIELGPDSEGVARASAANLSLPADDATAAGRFTPTLYVSPTSGQLSPWEESRVRLTFTPKRTGLLSFALPVWLERVPSKKTRPYLTLRVQVNVVWGGAGIGWSRRWDVSITSVRNFAFPARIFPLDFG